MRSPDVLEVDATLPAVLGEGEDAQAAARRPLRAAVGAVAAVLLFLPLAVMAAGRTGRPIENRAPAPFVGLDAGWDSVGALGRFLGDRLALRDRAVRADAWVDERVFHEDPAFGGGSSPQVIRGDNGFLFIADAIDTACAPHAPVAETAANLAALSGVIASSGRTVVTMIAPDKSTVHPELLPDDLAKLGCWREYTEQLWSALGQADIAGYVDLRAALVTAANDSREPLFLRTDSHWDTAGSLVAVEAALERFAPGLFDPAEIHYGGLTEYQGDLTALQGHLEIDEAPSYSVERPGTSLQSAVVIDDIEGEFNREFTMVGPPGSLVPGRTLMFLDSFGLAALHQIVPYFENLTVMRLLDYDPDRYVDLIKQADNVWIMSVERSSSYRMSFEIGSPEFVELLAERLAG